MRAKFYVSSTIITEDSLYSYVIYSSADALCWQTHLTGYNRVKLSRVFEASYRHPRAPQGYGNVLRYFSGDKIHVNKMENVVLYTSKASNTKAVL